MFEQPLGEAEAEEVRVEWCHERRRRQGGRLQL